MVVDGWSGRSGRSRLAHVPDAVLASARTRVDIEVVDGRGIGMLYLSGTKCQ